MALFQKKPLVVEAIQFTGDNVEEISAFIGLSVVRAKVSNKFLQTDGHPIFLTIAPKDWLIRDITGKLFDIMNPEKFNKNYGPVTEPQVGF